ncbi:MAG: AsmA-like C-terminal region-containing protein [Flavobacteriales bacterium]|nr:AsmA-like C-terminal region-containing protein [Flavobacteriales bacterium]
MKFRLFKKKKWAWLLGFLLVLPTLVFFLLLLIVYYNQDTFVQSQITSLNKDFKGHISVGKTHLLPFQDFPFISIQVDDVQIFEDKTTTNPILVVEDIHVGFDLKDLLVGKFDVHSLLVENGFFNVVLHRDGSTNIENALGLRSDTSSSSGSLPIHLRNIELMNLDIHKLDQNTMLDIELFIYEAKGGFNSYDSLISSHVDTRFELNIIENGDTSFIKHKDFDFHTDLFINTASGLINIKPSSLSMEHGDFDIEGTLDTKNEMDLDLSIKGSKPNFDMFIAFAPEDVKPVLESYNNQGKIYFNSEIKGPTAHGKVPYVQVNFGASEAYVENKAVKRRIEDLGFEGYFTTGEEKSLQSMEFYLKNMHAKLEEGTFLGSVMIKNFEEPDVDITLKSNFNVDFLMDFVNFKDVEEASGSVELELRFHDIVDLEHPEKALNELNKAYYCEFQTENLRIQSDSFPAYLEKLNTHLIMNGKEAQLDQFDMILGNSDVSVTGYISDLPAIVHHTTVPVKAHFDIQSQKIDVAELTRYSERDSMGINELVEDLSVGLSFYASARAFTESKFLPEGEFFVDSLHAKLKGYAHELHDFNVDIITGKTDLKIVDFTGYIDESDFHFNGLVHDYEFWMKDELEGDTELDITLKSGLLRLEDIFSYQGINYMPEDYRHEELENLHIHAQTDLHFKKSQLHSFDVDLDKFDAKMHVHPMAFKNFHGRVHYEDEHILIENFHGEMGKTKFDADVHYYLGDDISTQKRDNFLKLNSNYIDFDQLFNFNLGAEKKTEANKQDSAYTTEDVESHAEAFNIYTIPFSNMKMHVDIDHFIYHHLDLQNINADLRTTPNHYLYIDTLEMGVAGGELNISGYFNGSDPEHIYFKPNLQIKNADIDKLLLKYENFGEDIELSQHLHGQLNANLHGNIRMYPDMIPDIDQSEIHMDLQILNGRLENYEPVQMLSDYFGDKDLTSIRFDTLSNHIDVSNGELNIPSMSIETSLGHYELSGKQDMNHDLEYYFRIPWSVIKLAARNKLFGDKKTDEGKDGADEILEVDPSKKVRYLNLKIHGNIDDYKVTMGKKSKK